MDGGDLRKLIKARLAELDEQFEALAAVVERCHVHLAEIHTAGERLGLFREVLRKHLVKNPADDARGDDGQPASKYVAKLLVHINMMKRKRKAARQSALDSLDVLKRCVHKTRGATLGCHAWVNMKQIDREEVGKISFLDWKKLESMAKKFGAKLPGLEARLDSCEQLAALMSANLEVYREKPPGRYDV